MNMVILREDLVLLKRDGIVGAEDSAEPVTSHSVSHLDRPE
jgi:hypothetical protein